jgi:hypothetical protein
MDSKRVPVSPKCRRSKARQRRSLHERRSNVNALPEQFFDTRISLARVCPETALMYAVLEDALLCFQEKFTGMPHEQRCRAQEAARWFFSDDQHSPYSFVSICVGLGLDTQDIRNKLKYLEQDIRAKPISSKKSSIARKDDSESRGDYPPRAIIDPIGRSHYDSRQS